MGQGKVDKGREGKVWGREEKQVGIVDLHGKAHTVSYSPFFQATPLLSLDLCDLQNWHGSEKANQGVK